MRTKSRWATWSRGTEIKKGLDSFLIEAKPPITPAETDMGNPTGTGVITPAQRARQMGLQSDGHGAYYEPATGQIRARTINGELVFYDTRGGGGVVADGSGGAALTQASPSWKDPDSGMIIVPPAKPESPEEMEVVPDATPATAPVGYDEFMQKKKIEVTRQKQLERERDQKIAEIPALEELYGNPPEQDDPVYDATMQYVEDNLDKVHEQFSKADERFHPQMVEGLQAIGAATARIPEMEAQFDKVQETPEFLGLRPEEQQELYDNYDQELEKAEEEIKKAKDQYERSSWDYRKFTTATKSIQTRCASDPNYDLDQEGKVLGKGAYGEAIETLDGAVIKTGNIGIREPEILDKLKDTGVVPRVINGRIDGKSQGFFDSGKLAMTRAEGKPASYMMYVFDPETKDKATTNFWKARAAIHRGGVVHNDMHDNNVFMSEDGERVTILDFGLAETDFSERSERAKTKSEEKMPMKLWMEAIGGVNGGDVNVGEELQDESNETYIRLKENAERAREFFISKFQEIDDSIEAGRFSVPKGEKITYFEDYDPDEEGPIPLLMRGRNRLPDTKKEFYDEKWFEYTSDDPEVPIDHEIGKELIYEVPDEIYQQALEILYDGI
jgi:hypothetical protein